MQFCINIRETAIFLTLKKRFHCFLASDSSLFFPRQVGCEINTEVFLNDYRLEVISQWSEYSPFGGRTVHFSRFNHSAFSSFQPQCIFLVSTTICGVRTTMTYGALLSSKISWLVARTWMSSAYIRIGFSISLGTSFTIIRTIRGPIRESCGTPLSTCSSLETTIDGDILLSVR